jgi:tripeptidyl-peptidase I
MFLNHVIRLLLLASFTSLTSSAQCSKSLVLMEGSFSPHHEKFDLKLMPSDSPIRIILKLRVRDRVKLESTFWAVSNPRSSRYGQYLTHSELTDLVSPPPAARQAVEKWVTSCGGLGNENILSLTKDGTWLEVQNVTASIASKLLHCTIVAGGICANGKYWLPLELASYVHYIPGMKNTKRSKRSSKSESSTTTMTTTMTPSTLRSLYLVPANTTASSSVTQSTAQFSVHAENAYSPADLKQFHQLYGIGGEPIVVDVGPNNPSHPGTEGSLDIQYLTGVAGGGGVVTTWWNSENNSFEDWCISVLNHPNPPLVHSISYDDWEERDNVAMMVAGDEEFMKAGVRGLSLLFASGDFGTGCNSTSLPAKFAPMWPPSSPFVTAIGGTTFNTETSTSMATGTGTGTATYSETAWDHSGGGFASDSIHPRPSYQNDAIQAYLSQAKRSGTLPDSTLFNSSNRGFPDVSSMATQYAVIVNGVANKLDGTSASTPTWAALVTLLNDARIEKGKPPMGFLNPFLYQAAAATMSLGTTGATQGTSESLLSKAAFTDITTGANDVMSCFTGNGYQADIGWDPATGLGSPLFPGLRAAALGVAA